MGSGDWVQIGVDGGGSSARLRARRGKAEITLTGGPANITDFAPAIATLRALLEGALAQMQARPDQVVAHLGLAGVISPEHAARVRAALPALHALRVTDDRPTMIAGALGTRTGSLAALGTGSFVGRQSGGAQSGLGGAGFQIGDHASAGWAGRCLAEQTALAAEQMRDPTPLTRALLERMGGLTGLIGWASTARPADFAALAPMITAAPEDALTQEIMTGAARYITRALGVLGHTDGEPLCLTGGFGPALAPWLPAPLRAGLCPPEGSALDGAMALSTPLLPQEPCP